MGRTSTGETEQEMVRRHVAQGARAIEQQRGRVEEMRAAGHDTARAEATLHQFEQTQRMHVDHLRRLMDGPEDQKPARTAAPSGATSTWHGPPASSRGAFCPRAPSASHPSPALRGVPIRMVRRTPNARQAAAFDASPSSASRMASHPSSKMAQGRPPPGRGGGSCRRLGRHRAHLCRAVASTGRDHHPPSPGGARHQGGRTPPGQGARGVEGRGAAPAARPASSSAPSSPGACAMTGLLQLVARAGAGNFRGERMRRSCSTRTIRRASRATGIQEAPPRVSRETSEPVRSSIVVVRSGA